IAVDGKDITEAATGNGPVDAAYNAIARATDRKINITNYKLSAKGEGQNALGQVDITAKYNEQMFHGVGLATDVVEASAQALVHVMNLVYRADKVADFKQQIHKERELGGV
ncbi:MAG TPA: 2-isopropylmalate synthase, partial [Shewanella frigidimarina]|nr:2-isopropylmalate synthase [Shewanella frigidimarina]